jgi:hypothetical protein
LPPSPPSQPSPPPEPITDDSTLEWIVPDYPPSPFTPLFSHDYSDAYSDMALELNLLMDPQP